ncbi:MAG: hypothetical protein P9L92_13285 [Candidatus Electryonea clarkiae]|nr:hypothetical protein [Candidatus Electryonea clarkiae]MDP8285335.1 hypothetical protein [Candidatus Electryonea clarkiae]
MPKAAILATSDGDGLGTFSDGVVLAYEALNRAGITTCICDRTILSNKSRLDQYNILIASTLFGYHDADQRFSLTFIDDDQLDLLSNWIHEGGVLVAGENFGRNTRSGHDRLVDTPELNSEYWILGNAVGVPLIEKNLDGYSLHMNSEATNPKIWKEKEKYSFDKPEWILVPAVDVNTTGVRVLGEWREIDKKIPAVWENSYGSGRMLYFTTFRLLHPSLDGGLSTPDEIENFYKYLADISSGTAKESLNPRISVSPWFENHPAALAVTLNCTGEEENLERTIRSLLEDAPSITIFSNQPEILSQRLPEDLLNNIEIASLSKSNEKLDRIDTQLAKETIHWLPAGDTSIKGFRFPRLSRSHQILQYINQSGYTYDSSLPVNHQDYYGGSIYPVNLMLSEQDGSWSLNLMELGPIYRDDWSFYGDVSGYKIQEAAMYRKFLLDSWNEIFLPQGGLMVQIGDPEFEGESEVTLEPVKTLIEKAVSDNAWITDLSTVANFWKMKENANVSIWQTDNKVQILVSAGDQNLEGLTLTVTFSEEWSSDKSETAINGLIRKESDFNVNLISKSGNQSFYSLNY